MLLLPKGKRAQIRSAYKASLRLLRKTIEAVLIETQQLNISIQSQSAIHEIAEKTEDIAALVEDIILAVAAIVESDATATTVDKKVLQEILTKAYRFKRASDIINESAQKLSNSEEGALIKEQRFVQKQYETTVGESERQFLTKIALRVAILQQQLNAIPLQAQAFTSAADALLLAAQVLVRAGGAGGKIEASLIL